jgi:hypothetical protein
MGALSALHFAMSCAGSTELLTAPTYDQVTILSRMVNDLAERSPLADLLDRVVESPFPELSIVARDEHGREAVSRILGRSTSLDAKFTRGHGADRVIVDEAALVPDVVLTQTLPPVLAASRYGYLDLLSTPFGRIGYFHQAYRRGVEGEPNVAAFHFPSSANPAIQADYLRR